MTNSTPHRPAARRSWRRRLFAGALAASAFALASAPTPAPAATRWGLYHWARTTPSFTVSLGDDLVAGWKPYLNAASVDWSVPASLDTLVVAGQSNPKTCRATVGRVEVCNSKYGVTGWLGVASVWANGEHITQATAKMNDTYFNTASYNAPKWKQFVMCQELGHAFGLGHDNDIFEDPNRGTCMDYTNDPAFLAPAGTFNAGEDNTQPGLDDIQLLDQIYGGRDSTTTVSSPSAAATKAAPGDNRADWGRAIHRDAKGREDGFVRDLGNGGQVFSFVIWAD